MDQQPKPPHRRSLRIQHFDYSQPGYYFVTICTKDREEYFGEIRNGIMGLSEVGAFAHQCWNEIPNHYPNVKTDEFTAMPNHVHGIVVLRDAKGRDAPRRVSTQEDTANGFGTLRKNSLSSVVNHFKGNVKRWCNKNGFEYVSWQPNYYEHIIRNERSLERIREYIHHNPLKWELDVENQSCVKPDKKYYEKIFGDVA